jgi:putative ABC transport system permease protein
VEGLAGPWDVVLSLLLVAVAIAISRWQRLQVERSIIWASARAAVQLLAVGFVLRIVFESSIAWT